ncbi:hypothetical protein F511_03749 [Dorcoceras hygrometricum]|uniref:PHD-type domain-containing protein n=1 Tax=Dorcoceras hygrometricum TaxID=472368 RepID=A0A2Z7BCD8_9LAMI|nr:hypothetical protein F511_03749 [Dorcoceras hygrometricum]
MEKDDKPVINPDLGFKIESSFQIKGTEFGSYYPSGSGPFESDFIDRGYVPRVRPSEANGFAVYTRSKRFKSVSGGGIRGFGELRGNWGICSKGDVALVSNGEVGEHGGDTVYAGGNERDLGDSSDLDGEMVEVEVKEEPMTEAAAVAWSNGTRRFTRSIIKPRNEKLESELPGGLQDAISLEVEGLESDESSGMAGPTARKIKKIARKGMPTTVKELFETGLLEGYPVFYNGGKRGFPLRGSIKDVGILCSCSSCMGVRVVPPCQFEIHACKSYRRASQYICLENGKSLLDVVKECRKSSVETLEETIHKFVGPMPVKESVICMNCRGPFLATASEVKPVCDSCVVIENSEMDAECTKSRPLEPLVCLKISDNGDVYNTPKNKSRRRRKRRKHSELVSNAKTRQRSSPRISTRKGQQKTMKMWAVVLYFNCQKPVPKFSGSSLASHLNSSSDLPVSGSDSPQGSTRNSNTRKILKKFSSVSFSKPLKSGSAHISMKSKSSSKVTKKDQKMHRMVFEDGGLPDGTEVAYYSNGKKLRDGYKMGSGIMCRCCSTLVSPSQFEAHAGRASRRKPYMYIYTSNGVSLHEFAVSLLKGRKLSAKDNDDLCIICADGGKLVLCDGCPRAFHKECASLLSIPHGKWYCTYCQNKFQKERFVEHNSNAVAAGRVLGIDPIEQITNRCIRIVKNPEAELIACVICRGYDFSKSGFGPRTVLLCDQCEKEYHVGCLKKCKMADLKVRMFSFLRKIYYLILISLLFCPYTLVSLSDSVSICCEGATKGKWFCSLNCKRMYSALQDLLNAGAEKILDSTLNIVRKKHVEKNPVAEVDLDMRWRLLNGKITSRETRVLLSQAVAIFHDSFDPIVDSETGRDFIPSMVYGGNIRGQDFSGMYCAILTVNSIVVSAGILRIFGQDIAELPLAATRKGNHGRGYFQVLYWCIEKLLEFLGVRSLVLPATDEAKSIWTEKFGFKKIPEEQLLNYKKICWQMVTFKGTSMLEKPVPKCHIINQDKEDSDASFP